MNSSSPMHPHGPEIAEALNGDGKCLWCHDLVIQDMQDAELTALRARNARLTELLRTHSALTHVHHDPGGQPVWDCDLELCMKTKAALAEEEDA